MPFSTRNCQRGSIATLVALFGLGVVTLGIVAGRTLVEYGTNFIPQAATPTTLTNYYLPTADTYADQASPQANFGKSDRIYVNSRSGQMRESYLRFNINNIEGKVAKAELRLVAGDDNRKNSPIVYLTDNNWTDTGLNYSNKPLRGPKIADSRTIEERRPVTIDVTSAIIGNGTYSFVLVGPNSNLVRYNSVEASINKPTLTIIYQLPTPTFAPSNTPTVTSNATPSATTIVTTTPSRSPTPNPFCNDSDFGINIYKKGIVQGVDQNGNQGSFGDTCIKQTTCLQSATGCTETYTLNEGFCRTRDNGTKYFSVTSRNCALGCVNGACIQTTITPTITPTVTISVTPTIQIQCTPPACPSGQVYHCASGNCPGGCGTTCANPTPTIIGGLKPGDANEDGFVDGIDYTVWLFNYGKNVTEKHRKADFNGDGIVDGVDYIIWLNNFTTSPTPTGLIISPTITGIPSITPTIVLSITPTITISPTATLTPSLTPTRTPTPTCMPLPVCAYEGIPDGNGGRIYCDLPNANYCPKPSPTVTPTPAITCSPRPLCADGVVDQNGFTIYCLPPNGVTWCPKPTPTVTPTIPAPTCMPLPEFCVGNNNGDLFNICPWLDAPVYCPLPQNAGCNQSCSTTNPCQNGFSCVGIIPLNEATGSASSPTYVCRRPDRLYDSTCSSL